MPKTNTCPACKHHTGKLLENLSPHKDVTYYRCGDCGHVWVQFKDGEVHHVTPLERHAQAS